MYSKTNSRCKNFRILYILSLFALLFYQQAFSYSLSSTELLSNKDFFAQYKPNKLDKLIHGLISDCYDNKKSNCIDRLVDAVNNKKLKFYESLFKEMFFKSFSKQKKGFEFLEAIKSDLKSEDIQKIVSNASAMEWFNSNFDFLKKELVKLVLEHPNVLCRIKEQKDFIKDQLQKLSMDKERFSLDLSKHPCGIDTYVYLKDLKKEQDRIDAGHFYGNFKYKKLQKKAALNVYKSIKRKKTSAFWNSVFKANPYTQEFILRNIFFRKEYTKISYLKTPQFKKISPQALMYVAKAYLYKGEDKKLEALGRVLNFEKSEWSEEILLSLAVSQMKKEKYTEAKKSLEKLLKNHVNLRLSGLYWTWVINRILGLEIENREVINQVGKQYAFTYYGLNILTKEKGVDHLDSFLKTRNVKVNRLSLEDQEVKKLLNYYSGNFTKLFSLYFNYIKDKMNPEELALFAILLERMGNRLHAIKTLEFAWEIDESLRVQPFFGISYSNPFKARVKKSVNKLRYVEESLVIAVMRQESAFNPEALSSSGARGLMQVISLTGKEIARSLRLRSYRGSKSLFNPTVNLKIGAKYLDRLLVSSKGYLPYALASYNAGPGNLYRWSSLRPGVQDLRKGLNHRDYTPIEELWLEELPWSETRFYVKAVLRNLGLYRLLLNQKTGFACEFYWMCGQDEKKM